jgi:hypothetical protein
MVGEAMASGTSVINFAVQLGKPKNRFVAGIAVLAGQISRQWTKQEIGGDTSGEAAREAA